MSGPDRFTMTDAVAAWNRRSTPPQEAGQHMTVGRASAPTLDAGSRSSSGVSAADREAIEDKFLNLMDIVYFRELTPSGKAGIGPIYTACGDFLKWLRESSPSVPQDNKEQK
jgi:hypothetical protein